MDSGAEMLNFGALIAFMGVNLAAFVRYYVREKKNSPIPPLLLTALVIVLVLWPGSNWMFLAAAGVALACLPCGRRRLPDSRFASSSGKISAGKPGLSAASGWRSASPLAHGRRNGFRGDLVNFDLPPEEE